MAGESKKLNDLNDYIPPVEIRKFVQVLLSEEVKGNKEDAQRKTGVDKGKFYHQFKTNPKFREWYSNQCDEVLLRNGEAIAVNTLIDSMKRGLNKLQAVRLFYELNGKIKSGININNNNYVSNTTIELSEDERRLQDEADQRLSKIFAK